MHEDERSAMEHGHRHEQGSGNGMKSRARWVFIGFALIAAYFLITEHRAHIATWLGQYGILLLALACPLMHLFMHRGHGGHGNREHRESGNRHE